MAVGVTARTATTLECEPQRESYRPKGGETENGMCNDPIQKDVWLALGEIQEKGEKHAKLAVQRQARHHAHSVGGESISVLKQGRACG